MIKLTNSHEEGQGGEDTTGVESVVHLLLGWVGHSCIYHDPPAREELQHRS